MKYIKRFNEEINEANISRHHDLDSKKKLSIAGIKIGDKIKIQKSTSLFRRLLPSMDGRVAGYGGESLIKGEIYEFVNYWSDFALDSSRLDFDETLAMEFECKESPKKGKVGSKLVFSLKHFHEYKDEGKLLPLKPKEQRLS